MFGQELTDAYVPYGKNEVNCAEITETVTVSKKSSLYVSMADKTQARITENTDSVTFAVKSDVKQDMSGETIKVTIYRKTNGKYEQCTDLTKDPVPVNVVNGEVTVPQAILKNIPNGSYRIKFEYNGAVCYHTVVVEKTENTN